MTLDKDTNYIISGIERSGTSMLMQMIHAGGLPTAFNSDLRPADENNPKGYYELEGGKIINKLINGTFPFEKYFGNFIKITAYGLKFLPKGKYKIIYSERNIEEILDSMEKMIDKKDEKREETKKSFIKLNNMIKQNITQRNDVDVLFVNYNQILAEPEEEVKKIYNFIDSNQLLLNNMIKTVDKRLYVNKRT